MIDRTHVLTTEHANAAIGWLLTAVLAAVGLERALAGDPLWAGLAAVAVAIVLVPPVASRRPTEMIAWEVVGLAAVPPVARAAGLAVASMPSVSVAALALVVAVELDAFTAVEMTSGFAVVFVVVLTMAMAGLWTVAGYVSDVALGTSMLGDQQAVMWDLVVATGVGFVAGAVFEGYFRRISPGHAITREPWESPE